MKYIVALVLVVLSACAPLQSRNGDPFRPASERFLRVDNNGTEDVIIMLHPNPQRVGRCGSIQVCNIQLTKTQADNIAQGRVRVAYRRLSHRRVIKMQFVNIYGLELYVGRFDTGSWLRPR